MSDKYDDLVFCVKEIDGEYVSVCSYCKKSGDIFLCLNIPPAEEIPNCGAYGSNFEANKESKERDGFIYF